MGVVSATSRQIKQDDPMGQLRQVLGGMKSGQAVVLLMERSGHLIYVPLESIDWPSTDTVERR